MPLTETNYALSGGKTGACNCLVLKTGGFVQEMSIGSLYSIALQSWFIQGSRDLLPLLHIHAPHRPSECVDGSL